MDILESCAWPLDRASIVDQGVNVEWQDGFSSFFHHLWLRDNCRCPSCGDPAIGRRKLQLTDLAPDIRATEASLADGGLGLTWPDGHVSQFSGRWLRTHAYDDVSRRSRVFKPTLWTDAVRREFPRLEFATVMRNDAGLWQLLSTVRDLGLCFIRNAPHEPGCIEPLATLIGPIQESNFGRVQDLVVDHSKRSVANRTLALKPHTDEPYRASPPGLLLFHCVETDVNGKGSSTFLDGFEIAETLRQEDPEGFEMLTRHAHHYRRHFEGDVDLIAEFPTLCVDEFGNLTGVRINDRVAAPLSMSPTLVTTYYRAMRRLLELSEDPKRILRLRLHPGDIAVFDNHRILHGRTKLTLNGKRWLQWVQVERGDFHSALRIVADRLGIERDASSLLHGAYG